MPNDIIKWVLSKLPISERDNVRLVCRSWAIFTDSYFVRHHMALNTISWIINTFSDSFKHIPIDPEELCEFLKNDALTVEQKIRGLNNLPKALLESSEISAENLTPSLTEYFLSSKKRIKKILKKISNESRTQNQEFFTAQTSKELNNFFDQINIFLIESLRLSCKRLITHPLEQRLFFSC